MILSQRPFVYVNKGANGCVFVNLDNGEYVTLNQTEAEHYCNVIRNGIISSEEEFKVIEHLLDRNMIAYSNVRFQVEEPRLFDIDYLKGNLAEFYLRQAVIELDTECSLDCIFCDEHSKKGFASCFCKRWDYKPAAFDYLTLISELVALGVTQIVVQGGDPFSKPPTVQLIKELVAKLADAYPQVMVCFAVNGYSLNAEVIHELSQYSNVIFNIQWIGFCEEDYFTIAGRTGAYDTIMGNIERLKAAGIPVVGTALLNRINEGNYTEQFRKTVDIPFTTIYLYDDEFSCDDTQLKDFRRRLVDINLENYMIAKYMNGCLYGKLFIASNLDVFPCIFMRDFKLGNLIETSLQNIIAKREYKKFWFLPKNSIEPCHHCKYNLQCFDCRAVEYAATGDLNREFYCQQLQEEGCSSEIRYQ